MFKKLNGFQSPETFISVLPCCLTWCTHVNIPFNNSLLLLYVIYIKIFFYLHVNPWFLRSMYSPWIIGTIEYRSNSQGMYIKMNCNLFRVLFEASAILTVITASLGLLCQCVLKLNLTLCFLLSKCSWGSHSVSIAVYLLERRIMRVVGLALYFVPWNQLYRAKK